MSKNDLPIVMFDGPAFSWAGVVRAARWFFCFVGVAASIGVVGWQYSKAGHDGRQRTPTEIRCGVANGK